MGINKPQPLCPRSRRQGRELQQSPSPLRRKRGGLSARPGQGAGRPRSRQERYHATMHRAYLQHGQTTRLHDHAFPRCSAPTENKKIHQLPGRSTPIKTRRALQRRIERRHEQRRHTSRADAPRRSARIAPLAVTHGSRFRRATKYPPPSPSMRSIDYALRSPSNRFLISARHFLPLRPRQAIFWLADLHRPAS